MQQVTHKPSFNVAQELSKRFQAALGQMKYPSEKLTDSWFDAAHFALRQASPLSLGCSSREFQDLYNAEKEDLTMLQFAMLSNNIESKSLKDMEVYTCTDAQYFELQCKTEELSKYWNEQTQELRKKIEKDLVNEMATKEKLDQAANVLKPVKAEA